MKNNIKNSPYNKATHNICMGASSHVRCFRKNFGEKILCVEYFILVEEWTFRKWCVYFLSFDQFDPLYYTPSMIKSDLEMLHCILFEWVYLTRCVFMSHISIYSYVHSNIIFFKQKLRFFSVKSNFYFVFCNTTICSRFNFAYKIIKYKL